MANQRTPNPRLEVQIFLPLPRLTGVYYMKQTPRRKLKDAEPRPHTTTVIELIELLQNAAKTGKEPVYILTGYFGKLNVVLSVYPDKKEVYIDVGAPEDND